MARKGERGTSGDILSLDSLTDVVTNIAGMLILVAVSAALLILTKPMDKPLVVHDLKVKIRSPLRRTTFKRPVFFECRHNAVFFVEDVAKERFNTDSFYRTPWGPNGVLWIPKKGKTGETPEEIIGLKSAFSHAAGGMDPYSQYAFFIVRPDSFEAFRAARQVLWGRDIEVGWEPMESGIPLLFGSKGERPGVD